MKKVIFWTLSIFLSYNIYATQTGKPENNSLMIKYRTSGIPKADYLLNAGKLRQVFNYKVKSDIILSTVAAGQLSELSKYFISDFTDAAAKQNAASLLRNDPNVEFFEDNSFLKLDLVSEGDFIPDDSLFSLQWGLESVNAEKAWESATGSNIIIGVIDSGIDFYHPEFANRLWVNNAEDINHNGTFEPWPSTELRNGLSGDLDGIDNDGNGFPDDVIGYDFVDEGMPTVGDYSEPDAIPEDELGHGTNVSGVIAANANNKIGIAGLALNAKIMTIRAFDANGWAETDDIAKAIVYAALNHARVLNFSFGDNTPGRLVYDAVKFAYSMNCFMSASSGNNGWNIPHYPSDYPEVCCVGSLSEKYTRLSSSNYGNSMAILAPGENIYTTAKNSSYKSVSGTSIAAPFVSATAAMLLEKNPGLKPAEIKGIIQASASDIAPRGWDVESGSGSLNTAAALNFSGESVSEISYPSYYSFIDKDKNKFVPVVATVIHPLFESFSLYIGEGIEPDSWTPVGDTSFSQVRNDTISLLDVSGLESKQYTLNIVVRLKNYNTVEIRRLIRIVSGSEPLSVNYFNVLNTWHNDRRAAVISAKTSQEATMSVKFSPVSSPQIQFIKTENISSYIHNIIIDDDELSDGNLQGEAIFLRSDGSTVTQSFLVSLQPDNFKAGYFIEKGYSLPGLFLFNAVTDFYGDGSLSFAANGLLNGSPEKTYIYKFKDNVIKAADSSSQSWIPVGYGDSNGDGIPEFLGRDSYMAKLFQAKTQHGSPFETVLFSSLDTRNLWGAAMYDFDGDGKKEIICHSDTAFHIFSYRNAKYTLIAHTGNPRKKQLGTAPGLVIGDFDGDGIIELCHSNNLGNIFIYKFQNDSLSLDYIDSTDYSNSSQFMTSCDLDGDGVPEILTGNYGTSILYGDSYTAEPVWTFRILKYKKLLKYSTLWSENFIGVASGLTPSGFSYRNGVAAGNLDNEPGDEIIISAFPNLYIFKWDGKKMNPFGYFPSSLSSSALIYDFDKNGTNEFAFCNGNETKFFEYSPDSSKPEPPYNTEGWALSEDSVFLRWKKAATADSINIYRIDFSVSPPDTLFTAGTKENQIIIPGLTNNTIYCFVLQSVDLTKPTINSAASLPVCVFTHTPVKAVSAVLSGKVSLIARYSGKLSFVAPEPSLFVFYNKDSHDSIKIASAVSAGDSSILLTISENPLHGNYILETGSFPDYYMTPTIATSVELEINEFSDTGKIYLKSLAILPDRRIRLRFSEDVEYSTSSEPGNYFLKPYGSIIASVPGGINSDYVELTLDSEYPYGALGKIYSITAKNIVSSSGKPITTGAGSTLSFVFPTDLTDSVFVYPNPIKLGKTKSAVFAGLPFGCEVQICTLEGELICILKENSGTGGVEWDCRDSSGKILGSGIYIFRVVLDSSVSGMNESAWKKFMIIGN